MPYINIKKFPTLGHCIYCGATSNLEDEHIIPESLNGTLIFEDASCRACATEINKVEQFFTRGILRPLRVAMKFQSKHKTKVSELSALFKARDGSFYREMMPAEGFPAGAFFFSFHTAGILQGLPPSPAFKTGQT